MFPLKLIPSCKDYLWGGTKLKTEYHKNTSLQKVAESWELSCREDGCSVIANGELAGVTLREYLRENRGALGVNCIKYGQFPILVKMLDAKNDLSVQVHPDSSYAMRVEGQGGMAKLWYILDCEPGSSLLYGLNRRYTKDELRGYVQRGEILDAANFVTVKKGDVFFVDAGILHAMGEGIVAVEIQQNADLAYRLYDYNRLDDSGKPRPLEVDKALDVLRLGPPARIARPQEQTRECKGYLTTLLVACEYFTVNRIQVQKAVSLCANHFSFHSLLCLEGEGRLTWAGGEMPLQKGDSIFLPAGLNNYRVEGGCELLHTVI